MGIDSPFPLPGPDQDEGTLFGWSGWLRKKKVFPAFIRLHDALGTILVAWTLWIGRGSWNEGFLRNCLFEFDFSSGVICICQKKWHNVQANPVGPSLVPDYLWLISHTSQSPASRPKPYIYLPELGYTSTTRLRIEISMYMQCWTSPVNSSAEIE